MPVLLLLFKLLLLLMRLLPVLVLVPLLLPMLLMLPMLVIKGYRTWLSVGVPRSFSDSSSGGFIQ